MIWSICHVGGLLIDSEIHGQEASWLTLMNRSMSSKSMGRSFSGWMFVNRSVSLTKITGQSVILSLDNFTVLLD